MNIEGRLNREKYDQSTMYMYTSKLVMQLLYVVINNAFKRHILLTKCSLTSDRFRHGVLVLIYTVNIMCLHYVTYGVHLTSDLIHLQLTSLTAFTLLSLVGYEPAGLTVHPPPE